MAKALGDGGAVRASPARREVAETSVERERAVDELSSTTVALWREYDVVIVDLDGVVYRGSSPVPAAVETLGRLRGETRLAFVTNNASRPAAAVASRLRSLGVQPADGHVVTSAQAAARLVAARVPQGSKVLVVGGEGLHQALREQDMVPVSTLAEAPAAIVQGFHPSVGWTLLAEGAYAVAAGLPWVASNLDPTIPTDRGIAPGNGALVAAVATTTSRRPVSAGKPEPALFEETLRRVGGNRPLVIGDRLDTDVAGANRIGADSLLVLTGVSDLDQLVRAEPRMRPTFVACDLGGLEQVHEQVRTEGEATRCGGWSVHVEGGDLRVDDPTGGRPEGEPAATSLLRCAVAAAWRHRDAGRKPARTDHVANRLRETMPTPQG